jgi:hypothetical protein
MMPSLPNRLISVSPETTPVAVRPCQRRSAAAPRPASGNAGRHSRRRPGRPATAGSATPGRFFPPAGAWLTSRCRAGQSARCPCRDRACATGPWTEAAAAPSVGRPQSRLSPGVRGGACSTVRAHCCPPSPIDRAFPAYRGPGLRRRVGPHQSATCSWRSPDMSRSEPGALIGVGPGCASAGQRPVSRPAMCARARARRAAASASAARA